MRSACMHPRLHSRRAAPDTDRKPVLQGFLTARLPDFRTGFRSRATLDPMTPRSSNS